MIITNKSRFLLAKLHFDSVALPNTAGAIRKALKNLSSNVKTAYDQAMERIKDQPKYNADLAMATLSWVFFSEIRNTKHLQNALAIRLGRSVFDRDYIPNVELLGSVCAGLVIFSGSSHIRLAHHTTTEYFQKTGDFWFPNAQANITRSYITYFRMVRHSFPPDLSDPRWIVNVGSPYSNFPLLHVASREWPTRVRATYKENVQLREEIYGFLQDHGQRLFLDFDLLVDYPQYGRFKSVKVTALHLATYLDIVPLANRLLHDDHNPSVKDDNDNTPLFLAADLGHKEMVKLFLENGASPDVMGYYRDDKGLHTVSGTPLLLAVLRGHVSIVQLLLETGQVDVDVFDYNYRTPIFLAAENGDAPMMELLLETGKFDVNKTSLLSRAPLMAAASQGHTSIIKLLVKTRNLNLEACDRDGRTPLIAAAAKGHASVVKTLLETGNVDVQASDIHGTTPLKAAANCEPIIKLLLETGRIDHETRDEDGATLLIAAAAKNHVSIVKFLLEKGIVDVQACDRKGTTPLLAAASNGHASVTKLLLETGNADVQARDINGTNPLMAAAMNGHISILKDLIKTGNVDVQACDTEGTTPLITTAGSGYAPIIKLLLNKAANPDFRECNIHGTTPLEAATNSEPIIKLLLTAAKRSARTNDRNGYTRLLAAANKGLAGALELLHVVAKREMNTYAEHESTPLIVAAFGGYTDVVRCLLMTGDADLTAHDKDGFTPIMAAVTGLHIEILDLLLDAHNISGFGGCRPDELVFLLQKARYSNLNFGTWLKPSSGRERPYVMTQDKALFREKDGLVLSEDSTRRYAILDQAIQRLRLLYGGEALSLPTWEAYKARFVSGRCLTTQITKIY